jgi:hypothetical protein
MGRREAAVGAPLKQATLAALVESSREVAAMRVMVQIAAMQALAARLAAHLAPLLLTQVLLRYAQPVTAQFGLRAKS